MLPFVKPVFLRQQSTRRKSNVKFLLMFNYSHGFSRCSARCMCPCLRVLRKFSHSSWKLVLKDINSPRASEPRNLRVGCQRYRFWGAGLVMFGPRCNKIFRLIFLPDQSSPQNLSQMWNFCWCLINPRASSRCWAWCMCPCLRVLRNCSQFVIRAISSHFNKCCSHHFGFFLKPAQI